MKILAIETSCDETSIAVMQFEADGSFKLLSNIVSSQVKIHAPYGGVVPMLAKREHQRNLLPVLKKTLDESKLLKISNFQFPCLAGRQAISKQIAIRPGRTKTQKLKKILEREDV